MSIRCDPIRDRPVADFAAQKNAFAAAMSRCSDSMVSTRAPLRSIAAANLQIRFIDVQGLSSSAGPTTLPLSELMGLLRLDERLVRIALLPVDHDHVGALAELQRAERLVPLAA